MIGGRRKRDKRRKKKVELVDDSNNTKKGCGNLISNCFEVEKLCEHPALGLLIELMQEKRRKKASRYFYADLTGIKFPYNSLRKRMLERLLSTSQGLVGGMEHDVRKFKPRWESN